MLLEAYIGRVKSWTFDVLLLDEQAPITRPWLRRLADIPCAKSLRLLAYDMCWQEKLAWCPSLFIAQA